MFHDYHSYFVGQTLKVWFCHNFNVCNTVLLLSDSAFHALDTENFFQPQEVPFDKDLPHLPPSYPPFYCLYKFGFF